MTKRKVLLASLLVGYASAIAGSELSLMPRPVSITQEDGKAFQLSPSTAIIFDQQLKSEAELLAARLRSSTGFPIQLYSEQQAAIKEWASPPITLDLGDSRSTQKSSYSLSSSAEHGVKIIAKDPSGAFYGTRTLIQLLPAEIEARQKQESHWTIPNCKISDAPRFHWRGMHLDESRHFYGKEFAKRYIDLIADHKMNVFHWHLIDDGGWRLEIKKYPRLTQFGAFRKGSSKGWSPTELTFPTNREELNAGPNYGGFYTQEDIKEIVAYAAARHVRVIPEIELPGHSLPALDTHPHLRCAGSLKSDDQTWTPSRQNSYCAGKDASFEFLENILLEVFALFPDEYVHIGGDEVIKSFWAQCPDCKKRMQTEGLRSTNQLQSYFIRRMEKFINQHNKRLIGWDEITHGGLAPNATVMFWLGMNAIPATAAKGHDIIMSPTSPCYFDYVYPKNNTPKVYRWEPVPDSLRGTPMEKHIIGGQANVWTEHMETTERVEFMILPRMLAMAEVLWTPAVLRNYDDFSGRLIPYYKRLDVRGLNYCLPSPRPAAAAHLFDREVEVGFQSAPEGFKLHYTVDGSEPTPNSPTYQEPITVRKDTLIRSALIRNGQSGPIVEVECKQYIKQKDLSLKPGLVAEYAAGKIQSCANFDQLPNPQKSIVAAPTLSISRRADFFATRFSGFIKITQAGVYTFTLGSDDGSILKLGGATLINHDGPHGYSKKTGSIMLQPGFYPIEIVYFELTGGQRLDLSIMPPEGKETPLPASILFHQP